MQGSPFKRVKLEQEGFKYGLSPVMVSADKVLDEKDKDPEGVDLRVITDHGVSPGTARKLMNHGWIVCSSPLGKQTNVQYDRYLANKDVFTLFHLFCETEPKVCVSDLHFFNFKYINRILVALIKESVVVNNNLGDFVGSDRPFASSTIKDVNYPALLRHVDYLEKNVPKLHMKVGVDVSNEEFNDVHRRLQLYKELLQNVESKFVNYIQRKGYKVDDESLLEQKIQQESLAYLKDIEKKGRDKAAHFFTDMIYEEAHVNMIMMEESVKDLVEKEQLLDESWDTFSDEEELGKKALVLEYLKQQLHLGALGQRFSDSRKIAFFLVEDFLKSHVEQSKIVTFGDMWAILPGKKCSEPEDAMLRLKVEIP